MKGKQEYSPEFREEAVKLVTELEAEGLPVRTVRLSSSVKIRESHQAAKPLIHFDPKHKLSQEFVNLYQELSAV